MANLPEIHVNAQPRGDAEHRFAGYTSPMAQGDTHNLGIGYLLWIFGFMGSHRFYYGRPVSGTIWFFTLGLLGIGWLIDLLLMPSLDRSAELRYDPGPISHNVTWILLTFTGVFGLHKLYMGRYLMGLIYFLTGGLFMIGVLYDYWTLNEQVSEANLGRASA